MRIIHWSNIWFEQWQYIKAYYIDSKEKILYGGQRFLYYWKQLIDPKQCSLTFQGFSLHREWQTVLKFIWHHSSRGAKPIPNKKSNSGRGRMSGLKWWYRAVMIQQFRGQLDGSIGNDAFRECHPSTINSTKLSFVFCMYAVVHIYSPYHPNIDKIIINNKW